MNGKRLGCVAAFGCLLPLGLAGQERLEFGGESWTVDRGEMKVEWVDDNEIHFQLFSGARHHDYRNVAHKPYSFGKLIAIHLWHIQVSYHKIWPVIIHLTDAVLTVRGCMYLLLRFCGPIQVIVRRATRDLELAAGKLREGDMVGLLLGSANRDERQFAHADRLDLRRDARAHVAFGLGTHFCVGAPLARLEARVAFELILQRLDGIERVPEQLEFPANLIVRGPERLRLRFTARAA